MESTGQWCRLAREGGAGLCRNNGRRRHILLTPKAWEVVHPGVFEAAGRSKAADVARQCDCVGYLQKPPQIVANSVKVRRKIGRRKRWRGNVLRRGLL